MFEHYALSKLRNKYSKIHELQFFFWENDDFQENPQVGLD